MTGIGPIREVSHQRRFGASGVALISEDGAGALPNQQGEHKRCSHPEVAAFLA